MEQSFNISEITDIAQIMYTHICEHAAPTTATIVCVHGQLGAGKTTLVSALAKNLNILQNIQSPTFVILKNYPLISDNIFTHLIHIDAYRLEKESDLEKLRWSEYFQNPKNLICIEWSEHVPELIPDTALHVYLEHANEDERTIKIVY
jgi:tRNA threonylcarbamoyladenosine biosynthesis protein TsaE